MKQSIISGHPLFRSNALHMITEAGEVGAYSFLVDALFVPENDKKIEHHEVAHRALTHLNMKDSTFTVIRGLVGISHTLISLIVQYMLAKNILVDGKKLEDIAIKESGDANQTERNYLLNLFNRLKYVEDIIDMGWRGLEPIAEIAAIDFAEGVKYAAGDWNLSTENNEGEVKSISLEEKTRLIEAFISNYPSDYFGYNTTTYGSFQEAVRQTWQAYIEIPDDEVRKELLRFSMNLLYLDEQNVIQNIDPLSIILGNATVAQTNPLGAFVELDYQRQQIGQKGRKLVEYVASQVLHDIHVDFQRPRLYMNQVEQLTANQSTAWKRRDIIIPLHSIIVYAVDPAQGFLRFQWGSENTVSINSTFLLRVAKDDKVPQDWWRRVMFLESARQALKNGEQIICPFRGWNVSSPYLEVINSIERVPDISCNKKCFIREWIHLFSWMSRLSQQYFACIE